MSSDARTLETLFPVPTRPPSSLSPTAMPGVDPDAGEMLVKCLKENHTKYHVFFNNMRFHNHLPHHVLAAYKMGAKASLIKAAYDEQAATQRAAFESPGPINGKNWKDHLGDDKYYKAYLDFFTIEVINKGVSSTLETFVFASDANWGSERDPAKAPRMLDRFLGGLLHPLIHFGHGAEFGVPGISVEGLAYTAVHIPPAPELMPPEFFESATADGTLARLTQTLGLTSAPGEKNAGVHLFTVLARMLKDARLTPGVIVEPSSNTRFADALRKEGPLLYSYVKQWHTSGELSAQLEEIHWFASVVYGIGGWSPTRDRFRADFDAMHLVTSSLFLPSVAALLRPASQHLLLRAYLGVALTYWVAQGRPVLPIHDFYARVSASPKPPGPDPQMNDATLDKDIVVQNGWFGVLQSVLPHPDEHLLKLSRALAHYSVLYGHRAKGFYADTELEGAEELDGTLFVRVVGLSLQHQGPVREGGQREQWNFEGFFDDLWDEFPAVNV